MVLSFRYSDDWLYYVCCFAGKIVLEALILTSAVVSSLTGYAFWASKKGKDFSYLGPLLFTCLFTLVLTGMMQVCISYHLIHMID